MKFSVLLAGVLMVSLLTGIFAAVPSAAADAGAGASGSSFINGHAASAASGSADVSQAEAAGASGSASGSGSMAGSAVASTSAAASQDAQAGEKDFDKLSGSTSAQASAEAEESAKAEAAVGQKIAAVAKKHRECALQIGDGREKCRVEERKMLQETIAAAQAEHAAVVKESEGASASASAQATEETRGELKEKAKAKVSESSEAFAKAEQDEKARLEKLQELRAKQLGEMTSQERAEFRGQVEAVVAAHARKQEKLLDKLAAEGFDSQAIAQERANLQAEEQAFVTAKTAGERQAAVEEMNAKWRAFASSVKGDFVKIPVRLALASASEAALKARVTQAELASRGRSTQKLEANIEKVEQKIGELREEKEGLSFAELRLKLLGLHDSFVGLKTSIVLVANGAEAVELPAASADATQQTVAGASASGEHRFFIDLGTLLGARASGKAGSSASGGASGSASAGADGAIASGSLIQSTGQAGGSAATGVAGAASGSSVVGSVGQAAGGAASAAAGGSASGSAVSTGGGTAAGATGGVAGAASGLLG